MKSKQIQKKISKQYKSLATPQSKSNSVKVIYIQPITDDSLSWYNTNQYLLTKHIPYSQCGASSNPPGSLLEELLRKMDDEEKGKSETQSQQQYNERDSKKLIVKSQ